MECNSKCNSTQDENSLGILSMDNIKVFGDSLTSPSSSTRSISERLNTERLKAIEALKNPRRSETKQMKPSCKQLNHDSVLLEHTNDLQRPQAKSLNISELISDETINLNSSSSIASASASAQMTENKISFEPAEITGRSTLYKQNLNANEFLYRSSNVSQNRQIPSVGDILATSFAEKARNLTKQVASQQNKSSMYKDSSTLSSFRQMDSLPRTADLSMQSNHTLNGGDGFSFSSEQKQSEFNESNFSAAGEFAPGELMQSKLALDEISWAHEYAAIPTATLSKQAKEKAAIPNDLNVEDIDTSITNSMIAGDPNFSVGSLFRKRSDSIINYLVGSKNTDSVCMPSEFVQTTELNSNTRLPSSMAQTPVVDNKTYTKIKKQIEISEQKSKNEKDSYLLSLSVIDRLLRNMNLDTDSSTAEVVNKLIGNGEKPQSEAEIYTEIEDDSSSNKENFEPISNGNSAKHSDTMSFSESILNSTDFRQLQQSISAPRTPLSPLSDLSNTRPKIKVTASEEHYADIDEWPSTPVKSPHRRVRRTKSPHQLLPNKTTDKDSLNTSPVMLVEDLEKTPVNEKPPGKVVDTGSCKPKSLSSTRLDGCELLPDNANCVFGSSPNLTQSGLNTHTNRIGRDNLNNSPIPSPRSCISVSPLDSTSNSERRFLFPGNVRKVNTSPAGSETSSTNSSLNAARRAASAQTATVRSISRSSNSSEFSHRDGKNLPLKVTHLQLCWKSTKLRTYVRKTMQVKNTSEKRLVVRVGIYGPGFQLVNMECNTLRLQSQECRTIAINFCPTMCGAAVGMLSFYSPMSTGNSNISLLDIPLYAYGGNAHTIVHGLLKAPLGDCFLPMGDVCELTTGLPLKATFSIYNKGPLPAYASIAVDATVLIKPRIAEAFEVHPRQVIIPAGGEITAEVIFKPNRDDIKKIVKKTAQVLTLAQLRIICGDEPNRQRMRAVLRRMPLEEQTKFTSTLLNNLWLKFPQERELRDLASLKDLPDCVLDLMSSLRMHDVALTLNRDFNETAETSSLFFQEADETVLFRTICVANSPTPTQSSNPLERVDELFEADATMVETRNGADVVKSWSVKPSVLIFDIASNQSRDTDLTAMLYIKNPYKSRQYCEVSCNEPRILRFSPAEGYIAPDGGQLEIVVRAALERVPVLKENIFVMVHMENERINVPVNFNI